MVDAVRIIDLWQVILQEPRVAAREAAIIAQGEIEQHMVREKLEKRYRLDEQQVLRTTRTKGRIVQSLDKDRRGRRFAARLMRRQSRKRQPTLKSKYVKKRSNGSIDTFA